MPIRTCVWTFVLLNHEQVQARTAHQVSTDEVYGQVLQGHRKDRPDGARTLTRPASQRNSSRSLLCDLRHARHHHGAARITSGTSIGKRRARVITKRLTSTPAVYGDGRQVAAFQYVMDHIEGLTLCCTR